VTATQTQGTFRLDPLGEITLSPGEHTIVVRAKQIAGTNLMRLRQLQLSPVN
jgi:hypothetical protein